MIKHATAKPYLIPSPAQRLSMGVAHANKWPRKHQYLPIRLPVTLRLHGIDCHAHALDRKVTNERKTTRSRY